MTQYAVDLIQPYSPTVTVGDGSRQENTIERANIHGASPVASIGLAASVAMLLFLSPFGVVNESDTEPMPVSRASTAAPQIYSISFAEGYSTPFKSKTQVEQPVSGVVRLSAKVIAPEEYDVWS